MEFLSRTYLQTTTQAVVSSNTITAQFLFDPDVRKQFVSSGDNSDLTTTTITFSFDSTLNVDRISILETNVKGFNVYYNGVTANAFTLTNPTTTSQFTNNSATNVYLACSTVACTSVTFDLKTTQVANTEKAVGYIYIGANELTFPRLPNAANYTPIIDPKDINHTLSDGGTRRHVVQEKWSVKIKYSNITQSFRDDLLEIYKDYQPKTFVPFGTGTGWDGILFECNWLNNFDFYKYSDDATESGYSGSIELKET